MLNQVKAPTSAKNHKLLDAVLAHSIPVQNAFVTVFSPNDFILELIIILLKTFASTTCPTFPIGPNNINAAHNSNAFSLIIVPALLNSKLPVEFFL